MARKVEDYGHLTDIQHVYMRPDTYIGNCEKEKRDELIFDSDKEKIFNREVDLPNGVIRLFLEILSNATDNADVSRNAKLDPKRIEINITDKSIKIKNYGMPIPVKKITLAKTNKGADVKEYTGEGDYLWLPHLIFGKLRTSNNYDDDDGNRKSMGNLAGRNGYGSKLVLIFSKLVTIVIHDANEGKKFKGVWKDNLFKDNPDIEPEIEVTEDKDLTESFVSFEYELDFKKFKMKKYTEVDKELLYKTAIDFSFTAKIKITINNIEYDYRDIIDYAKLYYSDDEEYENKKKKILYKWEDKTKKSLTKADDEVKRKIIAEAKESLHIPKMEILIIDGGSNTHSYVNGLITIDGGTHVDGLQKPLFERICNIFNEKKAKEGSETLIKPAYVKKHLTFFINARLGSTAYNSQSKTKLVKPVVKFTFSKKDIEFFNDWELYNNLDYELKLLNFKHSKKSDGSKTKNIKNIKGSDANFAGTKKSQECVLFLIEGDSAANYIEKRINHLEGGKDIHGFFPLKGKPLNVTNASELKYSENKEIASIKEYMGFKEDVDYSDEENIKKLRYGKIVVAGDADVDGLHIIGHVLNFIFHKFKGMIERNLVGYLRTPIVKIYKGKKIVKRFYKENEFEEWKNNNTNKTLRIKYLKGLGSSNDLDIKDDIDTAKTVMCYNDDACEKNFDIAFRVEYSNERKKWIEKFRNIQDNEDEFSGELYQEGDERIKEYLREQAEKSEVVEEDNEKEGEGEGGKEKKETNKKFFIIEKENHLYQDISQFLNRELISFSVASLVRAIPSEYDLLKDAQRKALYGALCYFNYKCGYETEKTSILTLDTSKKTHYHHGEKSLSGVYTKMTQNFLGSNIYGWFYPDAQFGSRSCGGVNAADPRYTFLRLEWWMPYIYEKESIEFIEKNIIEDNPAEPKWIPGVIPLGVVNGTHGIATGYSTSTLSHNPIDVTNWLIQRCKGKDCEEIPHLLPYFDGYKGKTEIHSKELNKTETVQYNPIISPVRKKKLEEEKEAKKKEKEGKGESDSEDENTKENQNLEDEEEKALMEHAENSKINLKAYGVKKVIGFHKHGNGGPIIKVTEIPPKISINKYKKWLIEERNNKNIHDFKDNCSTSEINFEIEWNQNKKDGSMENLGLVRNFAMSNITLIDENGTPKVFSSIQEIMENYYTKMYNHYRKLKKHKIEKEEKRLEDLKYKLDFCILIRDKKIKIIDVDEDEIKEKLEKFKIPYSIYENSKAKDLSENSIVKYEKQYEDGMKNLENFKSKSVQEIWLEKLNVLLKELKKRYKKNNFGIKSFSKD